ncbi:hypothetical protein [Nocardia wallacei]|uniref:hypothetical protein n=1 Tax=Nocardia wallacei TaxID=480035 RepID=UPI00245589A8|nr:hypothetical protein [Nocardia wallacei]
MPMSPGDAEAALIEWRKNNEIRDQLVREAYDAGVTVHRIHILSGIGRNTVYKIVGDSGE